MNVRQRPLASRCAFWVGVVFFVVGGPLVALGLLSGLNMHKKDPHEGEMVFIVGAICMFVGLLSSVFSVVSGTLLRSSQGRSGIWPILSVLACIVAVGGVIAYFMAKVHGWL